MPSIGHRNRTLPPPELFTIASTRRWKSLKSARTLRKLAHLSLCPTRIPSCIFQAFGSSGPRGCHPVRSLPLNSDVHRPRSALEMPPPSRDPPDPFGTCASSLSIFGWDFSVASVPSGTARPGPTPAGTVACCSGPLFEVISTAAIPPTSTRTAIAMPPKTSCIRAFCWRLDASLDFELTTPEPPPSTSAGLSGFMHFLSANLRIASSISFSSLLACGNNSMRSFLSRATVSTHRALASGWAASWSNRFSGRPRNLQARVTSRVCGSKSRTCLTVMPKFSARWRSASGLPSLPRESAASVSRGIVNVSCSVL